MSTSLVKAKASSYSRRHAHPRPSGFPRFRDLPPELRIRIWQMALSLPTVWAASFSSRRNPPGSPHPRSFSFRMKHIGPAAYIVGASCSEARQEMKLLCDGAPVPSFNIPRNGGSYWINFDTTVVYMDHEGRAKRVYQGFGAQWSTRLKHVAIRSESSMSSAIEVLKTLAKECPALETIIIQGTEAGDQGFDLARLPERAARYAKLAQSDGPEVNELCSKELREMLLDGVDRSRLKVQLLGAKQSQVL